MRSFHDGDGPSGVDDSTFSSMTIEALLDAGALRTRTAAALRSRYLPR